MALLSSAEAPPLYNHPLKHCRRTDPLWGLLIYDTQFTPLLVMKAMAGSTASASSDFGAKVWANVIDVIAFLEEALVERILYS